MGVNFSEQVNISKLSTFMITTLLHLTLKLWQKNMQISSAFSLEKIIVEKLQ